MPDRSARSAINARLPHSYLANERLANGVVHLVRTCVVSNPLVLR